MTELPARLTTIARVALLLACCAAAGCGKPATLTAEVEGVLILRDKPADKVRIEFIPDPSQGAAGPTSVAETDTQGRFTLELVEGSAAHRRSGAVVGWHRVTLSDRRLSESATGVGVPIRFSADYTLAGSTPLRLEVKPGDKQTIEIKLP